MIKKKKMIVPELLYNQFLKFDINEVENKFCMFKLFEYI
jgi:hypothetical protein